MGAMRAMQLWPCAAPHSAFQNRPPLAWAETQPQHGQLKPTDDPGNTAFRTALPRPLPVPTARHRQATQCWFPGRTAEGVRFRVEAGGGGRRVVAAGGRRQAAGDGRGASPPRRPRLHPGLGSAMESGGRPSLGQFILLGTSSVVTAVLYSVYRQKAQVAQELKVSAGALLASAGPLAQGNGEPLIRHGPHHPRKRSKRGNRL